MPGPGAPLFACLPVKASPWNSFDVSFFPSLHQRGRMKKGQNRQGNVAPPSDMTGRRGSASVGLRAVQEGARDAITRHVSLADRQGEGGGAGVA
ncbi:hypothetical protein E2C01_085827 [Portunus trituberculatus]|uniref:Uncharacterized protein n=1 Tax=Portunus trituberculatus TaxID=210409 RepID=A0A5B7JEP8_PORTR|nr:hypothetical protein [Portunus trituberculatus]